MATYTTSNRIKKAYDTCQGLYCGFGPVDCAPKRIRIAAFFSKRKNRNHRMSMMLTYANGG